MYSFANVEEVKGFIKEELSAGRHLSDIESQLLIDGVPAQMIQAASHVQLQENTTINLTSPVLTKPVSKNHHLFAFSIAAFLVLTFLLAMLLR